MRYFGLRTASCVVALAGCLVLIPACGVAYRPYYDPGGSGASIDEFTYLSEPHMPQSVSLVDLRTGETLFSVDIPPRQQLVVKFVKNHEAAADAWMPETMKWGLMPRGTKRGHLTNSMAVPPAYSRRLDLYGRDVPELPDAPRVSDRLSGESEYAEPLPPPMPAPQRSEPAPQPAQPAQPPQPAPAADPEPVIDLPDEPRQAPPGQMTPVGG